jgi:hypothetical protein
VQSAAAVGVETCPAHWAEAFTAEKVSRIRPVNAEKYLIVADTRGSDTAQRIWFHRCSGGKMLA